MSGPILIIGHMRLPAANVGRFKEAVAALVAATRRETGCLAYNFAEDALEPGLFLVSERWADEAAINAHNKTAHLGAFMGALPALAPTEIRLARYQTTGEQMLIGT